MFESTTTFLLISLLTIWSTLQVNAGFVHDAFYYVRTVQRRQHDSNNNLLLSAFSTKTNFIEGKCPPYLAIITETDACDSDKRVDETFDTIRKAIGDNNENGIDLISIRVSNPNPNIDNDHQRRLIDLAKRIMTMKEEIISKQSKINDFVVVINDNVIAAVESNVDGVHVKESKVSEMTQIRNLLLESKMNKSMNDKSKHRVIIGTSAHCIDSAIATWNEHSPDYFFIGTCYETQSHPEKGLSDLEGPELPGKVKKTIMKGILERDLPRSPAIFAIGGINEDNCSEPVRKYGADGVAVIRSVMQAIEPRDVVLTIKEKMQGTKK